MILIDGRRISEEIISEIKSEVEQISAKPGLAAVLVGENPASQTYVKNKIKACERAGIQSFFIQLDSNISEQKLLDEIQKLNQDKNVHGILVQLPLPSHINSEKILQAVDYRKDVDGFHPVNTGKMIKELPCFIPCTPWGVINLLEKYNIYTQGKHCVILGRSNIVGRPMSILMSQKRKYGNCTVTICHTGTKDFTLYTKQADIIILCSGSPKMLKKEMLKDGVVVIDVGINRVKDASTKSGFRLVGDADFDDVKDKCSYITPVPGGVGPMTIAMLLRNTVDAAKGKYYQL